MNNEQFEKAVAREKRIFGMLNLELPAPTEYVLIHTNTEFSKLSILAAENMGREDVIRLVQEFVRLVVDGKFNQPTAEL